MLESVSLCGGEIYALHHGVRNLTGPKGGKRLEESTGTFSSDDLAVSIGDTAGEGRHGGLDSDFDGFHLFMQYSRSFDNHE